MKNALIVLAPNFEEVEAVIPIDYLRRANIEVTIAGTNSLEIKGSHNIIISADMLLNEVSTLYDCIIIPGGPGTANLALNEQVIALIKNHFSKDKIIAAICASPALILGKACKILINKKFTCYPGMEHNVQDAFYFDKPVIQDGTVITSRSAGTAALFALQIIKALLGDAYVEKLEKELHA